jgi:hypothetical protein
VLIFYLDKGFSGMVKIIKCLVISPNTAVQLPRAAVFNFTYKAKANNC